MTQAIGLTRRRGQPARRRLAWARATLFVLSCLGGSGVSSAQDGAAFRTDRLVVESAGGRRTLQVEIAETPRQRAQGLMWRKHIPPGAGMLFDFKITQPVIMWMKNTFVSLDMLFITEKGVILNIARNTTPHSTEHIPSAGPVRAVLELPAGAAREYGIRAGDRVAHAIFTP